MIISLAWRNALLHLPPALLFSPLSSKSGEIFSSPVVLCTREGKPLASLPCLPFLYFGLAFQPATISRLHTWGPTRATAVAFQSTAGATDIKSGRGTQYVRECRFGANGCCGRHFCGFVNRQKARHRRPKRASTKASTHSTSVPFSGSSDKRLVPVVAQRVGDWDAAHVGGVVRF